MEELQLDRLAFEWREALDAAHDSLIELGRSQHALQFPSAELRQRVKELDRERGVTELDLEDLAGTTRTHLHRHLNGPRASGALLGLGTAVRACVFDLDGVLTASTALHAAAWEETFDELLARHHEGARERFGPWRPFARRQDYVRFIHGRPRIEGVHEFLASRGIRLPQGDPDDAPGVETACGLANRKNQVLQRRLRHEGARGYEGSVHFLELAHEAAIDCAVVSASANTREILDRADLALLVDEVIDGNVMRAEHLRPKPAQDTILTACRRLDVDPRFVATFETTLAGIVAGRAAGVERVVAVERQGQADSQAVSGADRVVSDLAELVDPALG